jgi:hypothetical protein
MPDYSGDQIVEIIDRSVSINGDAGEFIEKLHRHIGL